jgi:hypothetical protein
VTYFIHLRLTGSRTLTSAMGNSFNTSPCPGRGRVSIANAGEGAATTLERFALPAPGALSCRFKKEYISTYRRDGDLAKGLSRQFLQKSRPLSEPDKRTRCWSPPAGVNKPMVCCDL